MNPRYDEIIEVVKEMREAKPPLGIAWQCQGGIENIRTGMKRDRANQYDELHALNEIMRSTRLLPLEHPVRQCIIEKIHTYRDDTKSMMVTLRRDIRVTNTAYWIVASSAMLEQGIAVFLPGLYNPPILRNKSKRWHSTAKMMQTYTELVSVLLVAYRKLSNEGVKKTFEMVDKNMLMLACNDDDVIDFKVTGHAIVYAGLSYSNAPILFPLDCVFDLDGKIDGYPEDYRVIMFRPFSTTVTTAWHKSNPTGEDES